MSSKKLKLKTFFFGLMLLLARCGCLKPALRSRVTFLSLKPQVKKLLLGLGEEAAAATAAATSLTDSADSPVKTRATPDNSSAEKRAKSEFQCCCVNPVYLFFLTQSTIAMQAGWTLCRNSNVKRLNYTALISHLGMRKCF